MTDAIQICGSKNISRAYDHNSIWSQLDADAYSPLYGFKYSSKETSVELILYHAKRLDPMRDQRTDYLLVPTVGTIDDVLGFSANTSSAALDNMLKVANTRYGASLSEMVEASNPCSGVGAEIITGAMAGSFIGVFLGLFSCSGITDYIGSSPILEKLPEFAQTILYNDPASNIYVWIMIAVAATLVGGIYGAVKGAKEDRDSRSLRRGQLRRLTTQGQLPYITGKALLNAEPDYTRRKDLPRVCVWCGGALLDSVCPNCHGPQN